MDRSGIFIIVALGSILLTTSLADGYSTRYPTGYPPRHPTTYHPRYPTTRRPWTWKPITTRIPWTYGPETTRRPWTYGPQTTRRPWTYGPETTRRPWTYGPRTTRRPWTYGPRTTRRPWTYGPETTRRPWTYGPETTRRPWTYGPETTRRPWTYGPETTIRPWTYGPQTTRRPWTYGPRTTRRPWTYAPTTTRRPWTWPPASTTTSKPNHTQCQDFTYGECPESLSDNRLIAEIKYDDPRECTLTCTNDYSGHCKSITYEPDYDNDFGNSTGTCSLWTESVAEYIHQCKIHTGSLRDNPSCEDPNFYNGDPCWEYKRTGCQFTTNGLVGELKDILEETECRRACAEPGPCKYYVHNKDTELCFLYEESPYDCPKIVGPSHDYDNNLDRCLGRMGNETMEN